MTKNAIIIGATSGIGSNLTKVLKSNERRVISCVTGSHFLIFVKKNRVLDSS